jgi:hypothetical protein
MTHRSANITFEKTGSIWRVCLAGICKEHSQKWQAEVFYHQMLSNSSECAADWRESPNERIP